MEVEQTAKVKRKAAMHLADLALHHIIPPQHPALPAGSPPQTISQEEDKYIFPTYVLSGIKENRCSIPATLEVYIVYIDLSKEIIFLHHNNKSKCTYFIVPSTTVSSLHLIFFLVQQKPHC